MVVALTLNGGEIIAQGFIAFMVSPLLLYVFIMAFYTFFATAYEIRGRGYIYDGHDDEGENRECMRRRVRVEVSAAEVECPICLAHARDPVALGCGHAFHAVCITRWLATSVRATCPICRAAPTTIEYRSQPFF